MNELSDLLKANRLGAALEEHPRIPMLDDNKLEALLKTRTRDDWGSLMASAAREIVAMARERCQGLLLDETFVEAGCDLALAPHPRLDILPISLLWEMQQRGEMGEVMEWAKERHREIVLEKSDRYQYGWRGDPGKSRELGGAWKRAVEQIAAVKKASPRAIPKLLCLGGNGSSKSEFMPWYAIQQMVKKPDYRVLFLCVSENWAREVAMSRCFWNLPVEWRPDVTGKAKSGITGAITYTEKMGFSENKFILPNGSRCTFMFYENGNPKALEGMELDLVLGDEEVPLEWITACEYRLVRRAGTLIVGFTPISGVIPTVTFFRGALPQVMEEMETELVKVIETQTAKGPERVEVAYYETAGIGQHVGQKKVPLIERGADFTKRVVYFPTKFCPYPAGNYETLREEFATKRATVKKMLERAHGIPSKVREAAFPLVSLEAHALPMHERGSLMALADSPPPRITWWRVLDPASGRNAFVIWLACYSDGRRIIEREWPQQDDYIPGVGFPGAWAVASLKANRKDGDRGPAQEPWGLSYQQMVDEFKRVECELGRKVELRSDGQPIQVYRKILDSRAGNTESHGTTIQREFSKLGEHFDFASGKALNINTGNSDNIAGITLINNALSWDQKRPPGPDNYPKLMVRYEPQGSDSPDPPRGCANTWFSLSTWTGADGDKGACKDPVDVTHYALRDEPRYVEMKAVGGDGWREN